MSAKETATTERKETVELGRQIVDFIGPEGSGKTTIAKRLAQASGKPYIATGDILRDLAEHDDSKYGDACRAMLEEHRYLEAEVLLDILVQRFSKDDVADGFILDGGFRTVNEIRGFQSVLEKAGRVMPVVTVHLRVPGWLGVQRLTKDETARGRKDDYVEAVLSRMSKFYDRLGKRVTLIQKQEGWSLLHVHAMADQDQVFGKVIETLGALKIGG